MPSTSQTHSWTSAATATLEYRQRGYEDAITKQLALFWWLKRKGRWKGLAGGRELDWAFEYELSDTVKSYQGLEIFTLQEQDHVTKATAQWKQYGEGFVISGLDERNNQGEQMFNLIEQKEKNCVNAMQTKMNVDLYLDGTGNGSKNITGLGAIIAEAPTTGTLYNVDRAVFSVWQNKNKDINAAHYTAAGELHTLLDGMFELRQMTGRLKVGGKQDRYPDLILTSETGMRYYDNAVRRAGQGKQHVNTEAAEAGFSTYTYKRATMIEDEDCPADAGTDQKYFFINSNYLKLFYHNQANFKWRGFENAYNADGKSNLLLWQGELTSSLPAKHGLVQGVKAAA